MEEKKVRQILVYTDFTEYGDTAIKHALTVSKIFQAELNILHVIDDNTYRFFKKKNDIEKEVEVKLLSLKKDIEKNDGIIVHTHFESGCNCEIINSHSEEVNAMIIIVCQHPKNELQYLTARNTLKIIRKSRIPYLLIHRHSPENTFKNIILPLNHLKETKELASWASYFGKLNNSEIHIILPKETDTYTKSNLTFARKVIGQFNAQIHEKKSDNSIYNVWKGSLNIANTIENSLILCMNSKKPGFFDGIFSPKEVKIISNKHHIPVLLLNPRDDLFVPCV